MITRLPQPETFYGRFPDQSSFSTVCLRPADFWYPGYRCVGGDNLVPRALFPGFPRPQSQGKAPWGRGWGGEWVLEFQGGKTFCAGFCASLIAGSRRAFLCVDYVCLLLEFWMKCTRCERLLPVKHFYLKCLLFFVAWELLWIQNNQC